MRMSAVRIREGVPFFTLGAFSSSLALLLPYLISADAKIVEIFLLFRRFKKKRRESGAKKQLIRKKLFIER